MLPLFLQSITSKELKCEFEKVDCLHTFRFISTSCHKCIISNETLQNDFYLTRIDARSNPALNLDVEIVEFKTSSLDFIPYQLFQKFSQLKVLIVVEQVLSQVMPEFFKNAFRLMKFDGGYNIVQRLEANIFVLAPNLEIIVLEHNQINNVSPLAFNRLRLLRELILSDNLLESLEQMTFAGLKSLKNLNLKNNRLKMISSETFSMLGKLESLQLEGNQCLDSNFEGLNIRLKDVEIVLSNKCGEKMEDAKETDKNSEESKESNESNESNESTESDESEENETPCPIEESSDQPDQILSEISVENSFKQNFGSSSTTEETLQNKNEHHENIISTLQISQTENPNISNRFDEESLQSMMDSAPLISNCGVLRSPQTSLIIEGRDPETVDVPWQVGIYENQELKCSGTIITEKLVLSSANCFFIEDLTTMNIFSKPKEFFTVVTGKYFRDYDAIEPLETQEFKIAELFIPPSYYGAQGFYAADIAILLLNKAIEFQRHVVPVCIKYDFKLASQTSLNTSLPGLLSSWGSTGLNTTESSKINAVNLKTCQSHQQRNFITNDKFCAGPSSGTSACRHDTGGSLAFPEIKDNVTTYYIRGIVSQCDENAYTLLVNVHFYIAYIVEAMIAQKDNKK